MKQYNKQSENRNQTNRKNKMHHFHQSYNRKLNRNEKAIPIYCNQNKIASMIQRYCQIYYRFQNLVKNLQINQITELYQIRYRYNTAISTNRKQQYHYNPIQKKNNPFFGEIFFYI